MQRLATLLQPAARRGSDPSSPCTLSQRSKATSNASSVQSPSLRRGLTRTFFEGFDPGSERTLAAWIRHASRTNPRGGNSAGGSGERGSNAWTTCPRDGDSPPNGGVIPGDPAGWHHPAGKGVSL